MTSQTIGDAKMTHTQKLIQKATELKNQGVAYGLALDVLYEYHKQLFFRGNMEARKQFNKENGLTEFARPEKASGEYMKFWIQSLNLNMSNKMTKQFTRRSLTLTPAQWAALDALASQTKSLAPTGPTAGQPS